MTLRRPSADGRVAPDGLHDVRAARPHDVDSPRHEAPRDALDVRIGPRRVLDPAVEPDHDDVRRRTGLRHDRPGARRRPTRRRRAQRPSPGPCSVASKFSERDADPVAARGSSAPSPALRRDRRPAEGRRRPGARRACRRSRRARRRRRGCSRSRRRRTRRRPAVEPRTGPPRARSASPRHGDVGERRLEVRDRDVGRTHLGLDVEEDAPRIVRDDVCHAAPEHHVAAEQDPDDAAALIEGRAGGRSRATRQHGHGQHHEGHRTNGSASHGATLLPSSKIGWDPLRGIGHRTPRRGVVRRGRATVGSRLRWMLVIVRSVPTTAAVSKVEALRLLRRDPIGLIERAARAGDVVRIPMPRVRLTLVNHPDLVWDVLSSGDRDFRKSPAIRNARRVLGDGLLTSEGDHHRRQRRLIQPIFHHERIDGYATAIVGEAERAADDLTPGRRHRHARGDDTAHAHDRRARAVRHGSGGPGCRGGRRGDARGALAVRPRSSRRGSRSRRACHCRRPGGSLDRSPCSTRSSTG